MKKTIAIALLIVLVPVSAQAKVTITEIAWMGTDISANDEWIELYNDGGEGVSLDGRTLEALDGTPLIILSGTVPATSFFLLERTDDDTVPNIPADQIYVGALGNNGEVLVLKNGGIEVERIDASAGWPAGDNGTKETMQRSGALWVTGTSTPRALNVSPPPGGNDQDQSDVVVDDDGGTPLLPSAHSNPAPVTPAPREYSIVVDAGRDRLGTPEAPIVFRGRVVDTKGALLGGASYRWTFGDGSLKEGEVVTHTYEYPGTYNVVLNVQWNDMYAVGRSRIRVVPAEIGLKSLDQEKTPAIVIENYSVYEVNLGDWKLVSNEKPFSFPVDTIIDPEASLTLSLESIGLPRGKEFMLLNPQGEEFVRLEGMGGNLPLPTPSSSTDSAADARDIILAQLKDTEEKLLVINKAVARMSAQEREQSRESNDVALEQIDKKNSVEVAEKTTEGTMSEAALLIETVIVGEDEGMFVKIVLLPRRAARYITTFFGRDR